MSKHPIKNQMKSKAIMHRRQFGRVAMGVLTVVGLAACGGGGGDGEGGDEEFPLREAYYRINVGMSKDEVLSIIGREPEGKSEGVWNYRSVPESLMIHFESYRGSPDRRVIALDWGTNRRVPALTLSK